MASSSSSYNSPCAACKFLRRKCIPGCVFAPYFPPEEPQKFANVHKIFGASNVTKLLNDLLPHQREDAVNSLAYEAEARVRDPVYGCVGAISYLQRHIQRLQKELDAANADLIHFATCQAQDIATSGSAATTFPVAGRRISSNVTDGGGGTGGGLIYDHNQGGHHHHMMNFATSNNIISVVAPNYGGFAWNDHISSTDHLRRGGGGGGNSI